MTARRQNLTVEKYLEEVARFAGDQRGASIRGHFRDHRGSSELAMLASPTAEELEQLRRAVAIMTPSEKQEAARLTDEQMQKIAADARCDPGTLAIFLNGFALSQRRRD
jgi:hypothetical protein